MSQSTLNQVTICSGIRCVTPVRPNKLLCDKCKPVRINELLDRHLIIRERGGALAVRWLPVSRQFLANAQRNIRVEA